MSDYGTSIRVRNGQIYFDSLTNIRSYRGIKDAKDDARKNIEDIKSRIKMMCAATPKDMFPTDSEGDTMFKLEQEFNDTWEYLESEMSNECSASLAEDIVNAWEYDYSYIDGENPTKLDPIKDWDKISPEEKHDTYISGASLDDFKIKDSSLDEIISRAEHNFSLNSYEFDKQGKYVVYFKGKLLEDINGKYLWSSKESATNVVMKALNIYSNDYISKEYIEKHKDVIDSFKKYITWGRELKSANLNETVVITSSEEFYDECVNKILSEDKFDMTTFCYLGNMIDEALQNIVKPYITIKKI